MVMTLAIGFAFMREREAHRWIVELYMCLLHERGGETW